MCYLHPKEYWQALIAGVLLDVTALMYLIRTFRTRNEREPYKYKQLEVKWRIRLYLDRWYAQVCVSALRGSITEICRHFKTQKRLSVGRNKGIIVKFVINYHPSAIKLSISASGQRQSRPIWIETWKMLGHFCFQNALEQITSCSFQELSWFLSSRHSRIIWQLIEGLILSFLTKDIKNPMILPL